LVHPAADERLSDKFQVTVVLRLLLGQRRQLEQGELVDLEGTTRGRFKDWRGLTKALRSWIASGDSSKD